MKTYFSGDGYRETKAWSCSACKNYIVSGMDTFVDQHVARHKTECLALRFSDNDVTKKLNQIFNEASQRCELKELIWQIYQDPKKVEQAIEALKKI